MISHHWWKVNPRGYGARSLTIWPKPISGDRRKWGLYCPETRPKGLAAPINPLPIWMGWPRFYRAQKELREHGAHDIELNEESKINQLDVEALIRRTARKRAPRITARPRTDFKQSGLFITISVRSFTIYSLKSLSNRALSYTGKCCDASNALDKTTSHTQRACPNGT